MSRGAGGWGITLSEANSSDWIQNYSDSSSSSGRERAMALAQIAELKTPTAKPVRLLPGKTLSPNGGCPCHFPYPVLSDALSPRIAEITSLVIPPPLPLSGIASRIN